MKKKKSDTKKSNIRVDNLSELKPPTHTPDNHIMAEENEKAIARFVTGFGFPDDVKTTGKNEHNDFSTLFGEKK